MKKALSFLLVMAIFATAIIAIVPPVEAEAFSQSELAKYISLDVKPYFQSNGTTCSGASCMVVLNYFNCAGNQNDVALKQETQTYVYRMVNAINKYMGSSDYMYAHCTSSSAIEKYIYQSLSAGNPVIARVAFSSKYYNYSTGGHYTVVTGWYTDSNNAVWLEITDSYVNRFSANSYSNPITGKVYVPLSEFVRYKYSGESGMYLIYSLVERCAHEIYEGLGACSNCDQIFDWQSTFNCANAGKYTVVKAFTPRTDAPYDAATKASTTIKQGSTVNVEGTYTNAFNNTWYKFTYDSGKVGYVLDEYLELSGLNDLSVTCTGFTPAENASLPLGQGCHVWGTVNSNYPLKNVVAKLDGSQYTTWTAPNNTTTSFDINPTDINYGLKFGSLSAGKHTVTLIATDIHGRTQTFLVRSFNMVSTSCSHSYSSTYSSNDNNHWKICTKCGSSASVEAHVYSNSCDTTCSTCEYERTITHTYTNDCDPSCDVCGETRAVSHNYEYKHDRLADRTSTMHWQECSSCGDKKNEEEHTFTPMLLTTGEPFRDSDIHYMSCQICDWWERQPHIYDNDCDMSCNVCNYVDSNRLPNHSFGTDYSSDEGGHWHICLDCGEMDVVSAHVYTNDCDSQCNVCDYQREAGHSYGEEYMILSNGHIDVCSSCGYSGILVDHVPGAAATETSPQTCIQCGYEICPAIEHTHTYDDGEIKRQPTCTQKGESIFTCIDCGETLTVEVAATGHIGTNQCEICGEIIGDGITNGEVIRIGCESAVAGTSMSIVAMIGICVGILKKKKRQ